MDFPPAFADGQLVQQCGTYRAWALARDKASPVDLAWYSRIDHEQPTAHRLLPFCEPSLAIRRRFDRRGDTTSCELVICSAQPDGDLYMPGPGEEFFALRIAPENAETALGLRVTEMGETLADLPARWRQALAPVLDLAGRGKASGAWAAMAAIVQGHTGQRDMDSTAYAAALARRSAGRLTPADIARAAAISPRHLRRGFVQRYGLSPRALVRRLRLTAAMIEADGRARPDWAGIAAGHGFADQAHLIRTCRDILGESPGELHRLRRNMAVSFNS